VTSSLSTDLLERYDRDGILFPIAVLSPDEVTGFRSSLESIVDYCREGYLKRFDNLHLSFPWAYQLVTHDALLNAVEVILGPDLLVDASLVFYKPPQDPSYVSWHQDSVYSGWHLTPSISAWIALTASKRANGCMRVVPGSHKQGLLDHDNVRDDPNLLNRRGERVKMEVEESNAVDVVLQPGEMSLHHSTIIHGSNPNTSDEPRIGFIVRFVTSRATNRDRQVLRVRGDGDCSHLRSASPPEATDLQTAVSAWRASSGS
jgi:ectoine hydroxylase-related dioxygenase (phytanoyl-CoA dioxygenase family)